MPTKQPKIPTFDQILEFSVVSAPKLSPDGKQVMYTVRNTDWESDRFVTHLWLAPTNSERGHRQLTHGDGSESQARWSPDGKAIAFLRSRKAASPSAQRVGEANDAKIADRQIWLIHPDGGEARRLTDSQEGIELFSWSPNGKKIAYQCSVPESKTKKKRRKQEGDYAIFDEDSDRTLLNIVSVQTGKSKVVFEDSDQTVVQHRWSPDGGKLALVLATDNQIRNAHTTRLHVLDLATKRTRSLMKGTGPDHTPIWSPDGKQIAFVTAMGNETFYHANEKIAIVPARGGTPVCLTEKFDESTSILQWDESGIVFEALQGMASHLFRLDPKSSEIRRVTGPDDFIGTDYHLTPNGETASCVTRDATSLAEVVTFPTKSFEPRKITRQTRQTRRFTFGTREPVRWKSKDGTRIEGILYKPANFNPKKKYPLLVVIHGGPAGVSRPTLDPAVYVYPVEHWLARGAVVLNPNYRGSAGYGEKFRQHNVRNLGVGDMWDVMSGVDHLVRKGFVDTKRMGAMGWSQGGYISAFLATNTNRFKALSVGAGISNWVTYYVQTDVTPFTVQYLGANPWDDPGIYAKTSPMTTITQARTPTLIQHGEFDLRVPTPNAYELRQGLEDQGVPVKMILYTGQGHGLATPKLQRGALEHNREWFDKWVFGDH